MTFALRASSNRSYKTLREQAVFSILRVAEALKVARPAGSVRVAVLATGVSSLRGMNVIEGKNFTDDPPDDKNGHGTQVASLIAAIAPNAEILPVKVLSDEGIGSPATMLQGIDYAVEGKARI